jgi:hypothetical protein
MDTTLSYPMEDIVVSTSVTQDSKGRILSGLGNYFRVSDYPFLGKFMHIHVNLDFISKTLNDNIDESQFAWWLQNGGNVTFNELESYKNENKLNLSVKHTNPKEDGSFFLKIENIGNLASLKINDEVLPIPKENLLPLAETIILMNAVNTASENSQVEVLPGLYLPNKNFITGKIMEYAAKFFIEVSLKTLPFFYLSNYRVISQPAFFYSKKLNISNYNDLNIFDFFSGDYRIMGFKHVISTRECYSEFLLNKANALGGELKAISR